MTFPFPVNPSNNSDHHTLGIHVPCGGVQLQLDIGADIYVYRSQEDGRFVFEIVTGDGTDQSNRCAVIQAGQHEVPRIRVMINESIVSDDGARKSDCCGGCCG